MPIVYVDIDEAARQSYLAVYQQQAIARVDAHARAIWTQILTVEPWLEMVYLHRAVQGYAYLNDPSKLMTPGGGSHLTCGRPGLAR